MIDTRDVNKLGLGKFRTSADNGEEQTCYFNRNKSDTYFTSFFSWSTQAESIRSSIVKRNLTFILSIKASTFTLILQRLMESPRDNFNKLVQKTLTMEDPRIKNEPTSTDYMIMLQSQPMYDSDNAVDYSEEISQQDQPEKRQDFSQPQKSESKIVNRHKSSILRPE